MTRAGLPLALLTAASMLLAACGAGGVMAISAPAPSVLRVAIGVDPDTLDPKHQTTTIVGNVVRMIAESLTAVDQEGKTQPGLATGWQEAPGGLRWTFTLREGVRFSDGTPLDASAVKASLDRALDASSACPLCGALTEAVRSVDVVDASHVQLVMKVPLAADVVLGLLSTPTFGILSPQSIVKGAPGYRQQEHPVGTGPYVLQERVNGSRVRLVRNGDYWGTEPFYAEQVMEIVPDAATREAMVRSGEAQVALFPPIADLPAMRADTNVKVQLAQGDRSIYIAIDTVDGQQPLLRNVQVRQALNLAVNREAIIRSTLFGAAEPSTSVMAPILFGYCAQASYPYDPDRARSMLKAAGASGLTVTLLAPTGRYIQDFQTAQNVAGDLRAVGVEVRGPRTMDWPSYLGIINVPPARASVDMHLLGYAPGYLDASEAMNQFDSSRMPPKGLETSYYANATVDALLAKAQVDPNRGSRWQEYCDAQRLVWNDAPWIFLWVEKLPIVYSSRVADIGAIPNEMFDTVHARPA